MEQNNYNVTQDMVNKLSDGQKFSNFLELSTYLNILNKNGKPLGGNSKNTSLKI